MPSASAAVPRAGTVIAVTCRVSPFSSTSLVSGTIVTAVSVSVVTASSRAAGAVLITPTVTVAPAVPPRPSATV